jgi:flagellar protein FlaG
MKRPITGGTTRPGTDPEPEPKPSGAHMSFDLNATDAVRAARIAPERPAAPASAPSAGFADALKATASTVDRVDAIPASPPPEVIAEMLAAQRAIDDMHARGRTLHFAMDGPRVRIEVQDLDGNVLKQIPPSRALEVATGRAVE